MRHVDIKIGENYATKVGTEWRKVRVVGLAEPYYYSKSKQTRFVVANLDGSQLPKPRTAATLQPIA